MTGATGATGITGADGMTGKAGATGMATRKMCRAFVLVIVLLLLPSLDASVHIYSHAPGTVFDPRLIALVAPGSTASGNANHTPVQTAQLAVEDAPLVPQTRDPGLGRPPFTSSRLRWASDQPIRVTLRCLPCSRASSRACYFGSAAVLRGVDFDGDVARSPDGAELSMTLPAPPAGQLAAHFYLEASVYNASGPSHFARGTLFYFWVDRPAEAPASPRPLVDVTRLGKGLAVEANSTALQTVAIQRLLDSITLPAGGALFFPGPAIYRTAELVIRRPLAVELGDGAVLQHPAPPPPPPVLSSSSSSSVLSPSSLPSPPPRGACVEPAFLTVSAASGVHVGGRGGTLDANGFAGNSVCVADSTNVTLRHLLVRGSASWSTHIFRSRRVTAEGVKILSGADGVDPDSSQDVVLRSIFVHSNDDAIAVKATVRDHNTERITCEHAVLSTKKSCLTVGTESLSDFRNVSFSDVEGFRLDRGLVLYAYDGGRFAGIGWQRVRFSSFFPYADEDKEGAVVDFETKSRSGLSQLSNISIVDVAVLDVVGPSLLKGIEGARIEGVTIRNLSLAMGQPFVAKKKKKKMALAAALENEGAGRRAAKPFVFECGQCVAPIAVEGLTVDWRQFRSAWGGVQSNGSHCLARDVDA